MKIVHSARWFFGLAVACLVCFVFGKIAVDAFLSTDSTPKTTKNTAVTKNVTPAEDPLVTVVPKDIVTGTPQPLSSDPQIGAVDPTVTIVEFGDFQCDDCATMSPIFAQIVKDYPKDVRLVWKDFPLPEKHLFAEQAALAARCAQDQGAFWEYHDALFAQQSSFALKPWETIASSLSLKKTAFSDCLAARTHHALIVQGYFVARTFNLDQAPAYYINDTLVVGVKTYEEIKALVEAAKTAQKKSS